METASDSPFYSTPFQRQRGRTSCWGCLKECQTATHRLNVLGRRNLCASMIYCRFQDQPINTDSCSFYVLLSHRLRTFHPTGQCARRRFRLSREDELPERKGSESYESCMVCRLKWVDGHAPQQKMAPEVGLVRVNAKFLAVSMLFYETWTFPVNFSSAAA